MKDRVGAVLSGAMGYFWPWDGTSPVPSSRGGMPGVLRGVDDGVELEVLIEDALPALQGREPPRLWLGRTDQGGVVLLDSWTRTRSTRIGGSQASSASYGASTMFMTPSVASAQSLFSRASARFYQQPVRDWLGLSPMSQDVRFDQSRRSIDSMTLTLSRPNEERSERRSWSLVCRGIGGVTDHERGRTVEVASEVEIEFKRPRGVFEFVNTLGHVQTLLAVVFRGFVFADPGLATTHPSAGVPGQFWSSHLVSTPPGVGSMKRNALPLVSLEEIGGVDGIARWVELTWKHPRAIAPLHTHWRLGRGPVELRLIECALAVEYWVAIHARRSKWAERRRGSDKLVAAAGRVGEPFRQLVGDVATWADRVWATYNALKHDPSLTYDAAEMWSLAASAQILLECLVLDRVARTRVPSRAICSSEYGHHRGRIVRDTLGLT